MGIIQSWTLLIDGHTVGVDRWDVESGGALGIEARRCSLALTRFIYVFVHRCNSKVVSSHQVAYLVAAQGLMRRCPTFVARTSVWLSWQQSCQTY